MKKKNWLLLLLVAANILVFFGYLALDKMRTDTTPPQIEIDPQPLSISVQDPREALLEGVRATDERDGDVTASLVVESTSLKGADGILQVCYAAFDKAGNVAKMEREVRYTDYERPRFVLNGPLVYPYGASFDVLSTVGAVDALDGDIQHRVRATLQEETSITNLGIHNVQFQVSNSLGDMVKQTMPVEVYAADEYNARMTLTEYLVYLDTGSVFVPEAYLDTFTCLGEVTNLTVGIPDAFELKTTGQVMSQYPGVYPVEYRMTYTVPNTTREYVAFTKLIVIVEG